MSDDEQRTAQDGRDAGPVGGQVGQVVGDDGGRGDGGLQHTNERVTVQGGDDLGLQFRRCVCRGAGREGGRGLEFPWLRKGGREGEGIGNGK